MARNYAGDVQYRAVITVDFPEVVRDGSVLLKAYRSTRTLGPYPKEHTAASQITRKRNAFTRSDVTVTGCVEVGQVIWTPLGQEEDVVLVSKSELESLREDARKLAALEAAGVDNWSDYDYAMASLYDDEEDEG